MSVEAVTKFLFDGVEPYLQYADSGTEELGSVPEHWLVRSFRSVAHRTSERDRPDLPLLSVVRERGVIPRASMSDEENHNFVPDDLTNYKVVREGNLVINKMKAWQGSMGIAPMDGIVSPAYFVFDLSMANPAFAHLLLRSKAYVALFGRVSDGVRIGQWDLSVAGMKQIPVLIPPPDEQAAIVRFLDHADRRIQRFIRAKKKLIALLNEQKQAIIHHAVTRGLDPNVRLKPSGVEWLGDVPDHWEVVAFKRRVGFQEGPGIMAVDFRDKGVPLLRISCLRGNEATLDGCNYLDPAMANSRWNHFAIQSGDYLLSASGSIGTVTLAAETVSGAIPYTGILRLWAVSERTFMPFVQLYMRCLPFTEQIDAAKSGVGIEHFGPTHLKRMFMSLPPLKVQRDIVTWISHNTAQFAVLLDSARREIDLLREYRIRLISDVVTGKLDVREAAAKLPDEDDDTESLDDIDVPPEGGEEMQDLDAETSLEEVAS